MKAIAANQKKLFGTKPKILAVIPSPLGDLAVVWEQDSNADNDKWIQVERGYEINRITFNNLETGQELGYLKMGSMDNESYKRSFGDDEWAQFAWAEDTLGRQFGYRKDSFNNAGELVISSGIRDASGDERLMLKRAIWAKSHAALGIIPTNFDASKLTWGSLINLEESHAPVDETELDENIDVLRKELNKRIKLHKARHKTPIVDFVRVDEQLKGKGMGHALYIFGARMQATKGKVLEASGTQSDEAQKSWRLMKKLALPIITTTEKAPRNSYIQGMIDHFALDFRNK